MKPSTRQAYARRIDRALALLQRAIGQGEELPDLPQLAAAASVSPFHFHRVYRALTGETVGNTVSRLRLARAIHMLASDRSITEVALSVGYESPQAFARAFRAQFGRSASELRAAPRELAQAADRLRAPPLPGQADSPPLQVRVVSVEPFEVHALRNRGDYAELDKAYRRLFAWAAQAGAVERIVGLYGVPRHDPSATPASACEFDCAVQIAVPVEAAGPVSRLLLGGGEHAVVRHVGSFGGLEACCDRLLSEWLLESGYELRQEPLHHHYLDDPEVTPEALLRTDIYLPVRQGTPA